MASKKDAKLLSADCADDADVRRDDAAPANGGQDAHPTETGPAGPPPSDFVRIINKRPHKLDCPLTTGRCVAVGPFTPNLNIHTSRPIRKSERTAQLFSWEKLGWIEFQECQGGDL